MLLLRANILSKIKSKYRTNCKITRKLNYLLNYVNFNYKSREKRRKKLLFTHRRGSKRLIKSRLKVSSETYLEAPIFSPTNHHPPSTHDDFYPLVAKQQVEFQWRCRSRRAAHTFSFSPFLSLRERIIRYGNWSG